MLLKKHSIYSHSIRVFRAITLLTLFAVIFFIFSTVIKAASLVYSDTFTFSSVGQTKAREIYFDANGNYFVAGHFSNTVDFDPSSGTTLATSNGGLDAFVAKYNSNNELLWVRTYGGSATDSVNGIGVDGEGSVFLAGSFQGTVDFDPGAGVDSRTSSGSNDIALVKYDADGNYQYAYTVGGTGNDFINEVSFDSDNNVYYTGRFVGIDVDLDPTAGSAPRTSAGGFDGLVTRINSDGTFGWVRTFGNNLADPGKDVAVIGNSVFVIAEFRGTVDFDDTGSNDVHTSNGLNDAALIKYDTSGNYQWTKTFGGTGDDNPDTLFISEDGTIYIGGRFNSESIDFDPGVGEEIYNSAGGFDIFINTFNQDGEQDWAIALGGSGSDSASDVFVKNDNLYVTGSFEGTVDFNPSATTNNRTSNGGLDAFVAIYDLNGAHSTSYTFGGAGDDRTESIYVNSDNDIYTVGNFTQAVNFDFLGGSDTINSQDLEDGFLSIYNYDDDGPTSVELLQPGDYTYTNNERPTFEWGATIDTESGISKYVVEVDNPSIGASDPSGDFAIDNIPPSRTTPFEANNYLINYYNFNDGDSINDFINLYTKSSSQWDSTNNDGKLREGKMVWTVKAVDGSSNETSSTRNLFVDRTSPRVILNTSRLRENPTDTFYVSSSPSIGGRVIDPVVGGDASVSQDDSGPRVASGPNEVEIIIEKGRGSIYNFYASETIIFDDMYFTCNNQEIVDNQKQTCDKYADFEYTPTDLENGTYRVGINAEDNAGNVGRKTLTLVIGPSFVGDDEDAEPTPTPSPRESRLEEAKKVIEEAKNTVGRVGERFGNAVRTFGENIVNAVRNIGQAIASIFNFAMNMVKRVNLF